MKEHVSHFKALAYKNLALQLKRKANTCCQVFIPISIAIVVGVLQLVNLQLDPNQWISAQVNWMSTGTSYADDNFIELLYSNASYSSIPIGSLKQDGNRSGFLGAIPQIKDDSYRSTRFPFYTPYASPDDIDEFFKNEIILRQKCSNEYCNDYKNATAAINFNIINISSDSIYMDYVVQSGDTGLLTDGESSYLDSTSPNTGVYFINSVNNGLLRSAASHSVGIATAVTNMPYMQLGIPNLAGNMACLFFLPFGLSFLFSVYMHTIVQEKSEGLVQKMTACGLSMRTYWVVNFMYNYLLYLLIAIVLFSFSVGFGVQVFKERTLELIVLWLLWGTAQVSMCHFLTCFINSPNVALLVGFLLSIFGSGAGLALEIFLFLPNPYQMPAVGYLFYPGFVFYHGFGLLLLSLIDPNFPRVSLMPGTTFSYMLIILAGQTIIFFILTWYLELIFPRSIGVRRHPLFPIYALIEKLKKKKNSNSDDDDSDSEAVSITAPLLIPVGQDFNINIADDDDVAREAEIAEMAPDAMVRIMELTKIYKGSNRRPNKLALNKVSLHIKKSECFGLLGPNGAGKTTLLNILSGVFPATSGIAFIGDLDIKTEMHKVHKFLGIVPQFDVLWGELTVKEHLLFYFRLKAASNVDLDRHIKDIIEQVGLEEVVHRPASGLSGGQKRRLSIAIAMMGNPKLILMDEPTTGLDPSNRRALWDIVAKTKERHSVVISTHSMEEAEVLCSRIGIMRKAKLHSIGTPMELKQKFGLGYNIKLSHFLNCEEKAHSFVMQVVPNATLVQAFGDLRAYKVMKGDFVLSDLFKTMERNKHRYGIKEWSISQASLEEVFLAIVTEDEAESSN